MREILDTGQRTVEELVDRYPIACRPVRDLIVDYLKERQPAIDYVTLRNRSSQLARSFWADLEHHHPGIDSLRLPRDVAAAWKQRLQTKTTTATTATGETMPVTVDGQVAAGLPDDFVIGATDIPAEPVRGEPGRDLPPEIMTVLCASLDLQPAEVRAATQNRHRDRTAPRRHPRPAAGLPGPR